MNSELSREDCNILNGYHSKFTKETGREYNFNDRFKLDIEYMIEYNQWLKAEKRDERLRQLLS